MFLSSSNATIAVFVIDALFGIASQAIQNRGQYIHVAATQSSDKTGKYLNMYYRYQAWFIKFKPAFFNSRGRC